MAEIADQLPGELIESSWGNDIRDRTVQRYTTTIERDALNPSPAEGDLAWILGQHEMQIYYSGTWLRWPSIESTKWDYIEEAGETSATVFGDIVVAGTGGVPSPGPAITDLDVYGSGAIKVTVGASMYADTAGTIGYMGVEVSGSSGIGVEVAAATSYALSVAGDQAFQLSNTFVIDTLPVGGIEGITVTAKYRAASAPGIVYARRRSLIVEAL